MFPATPHTPVLLKEVIKYLCPQPNENFIDCTFGAGGHTAAILEKNGPRGKVLAIDADSEFCEKWRAGGERNDILEDNKRFFLACGANFSDLEKIAKKFSFKPVNGILLDIGLSSWHLEQSGRGFTFRNDEPLLMRYQNEDLADKDALTAKKIVNEWPREKIYEILKEYGQERFAKQIAENIILSRRKSSITTTFQLAEIIKKSVPAWYGRRKIHFATKTFQALRIAVNSELENIKLVLPQALRLLSPGGRIAVISYHSLEDKIIKNFFKEEKMRFTIKILTKKPIRPQWSEVKLNRRSRSAKLRAAEKI